MNSDTIKKVLVFRIGQLGDILVSVPAMWALRDYFRQAQIDLLYDVHPGNEYVSAFDVLDGSGIVDDFLSYHFIKPKKGFLSQSWKMFGLLYELRSRKYDAMVYLPPSQRSKFQIRRDRFFFNLAGIREFFGFDEFPDFPPKVPGQPLPTVPQEGDLLLERLRKSGIEVPEPGKGRVDVNIGEKDAIAVERWRATLPPDDGRPWIAVGPGSKMPAKIWPKERYAAVVRQLISDFDIWPVVFGGPEDVELAKFLTSQWHRGYIAAGGLTIRQAIAVMSKCVFFLGNDAGTMHMAVSAGLKCVAIFSARDYPGKWYPYGKGHVVLRSNAPCEGCMLEVCSKRKAECITSIGVDNVFKASRAIGEDYEHSICFAVFG